MITSTTSLAQRLTELRDEFDRSFVEPPRQQVAGFEDLLAVRVGQRRYALRLAQTAGVFSDRAITPVPGPLRALLGVAGFRGSIVPVYELGAMLSQPGTRSPRWLVLAAGAPPVALAFEQLDGHMRVPAEAIIREADAKAAKGRRDCLQGMVPMPDGARPIVDVPAVRVAIQALTREQAAGTGPDNTRPAGPEASSGER